MKADIILDLRVRKQSKTVGFFLHGEDQSWRIPHCIVDNCIYSSLWVGTRRTCAEWDCHAVCTHYQLLWIWVVFFPSAWWPGCGVVFEFRYCWWMSVNMILCAWDIGCFWGQCWSMRGNTRAKDLLLQYGHVQRKSVVVLLQCGWWSLCFVINEQVQSLPLLLMFGVCPIRCKRMHWSWRTVFCCKGFHLHVGAMFMITEVYLDWEFEQRVMLYTQGSLSKEYVSSHMCGVGDLL